MILIIDNYDSFVYNLARYVEKLGFSHEVHRNDRISLAEIENISPMAIILSPGPCAPKDAGICTDVVKHFGDHVPVLGVCLGHQAIGEAYGGETVRAQKPVHGKTSMIEHDGSGLFHNLPSPMKVGRYHSLVTDIAGCNDLKVTAMSDEEEIMAMEHKSFPVYGVQFHPESVLTAQGIDLIKNFINNARDWHLEQRA